MNTENKVTWVWVKQEIPWIQCCSGERTNKRGCEQAANFWIFNNTQMLSWICLLVFLYSIFLFDLKLFIFYTHGPLRSNVLSIASQFLVWFQILDKNWKNPWPGNHILTTWRHLSQHASLHQGLTLCPVSRINISKALEKYFQRTEKYFQLTGGKYLQHSGKIFPTHC